MFIYSMLSLVSGFTMIAFYVLRLYKNIITNMSKNDPGHGFSPTTNSSDLVKLEFLKSAFYLSVTIGGIHIFSAGIFHFFNKVTEETICLDEIVKDKLLEKEK
jgi:hypothetical protein